MSVWNAFGIDRPGALCKIHAVVPHESGVGDCYRSVYLEMFNGPFAASYPRSLKPQILIATYICKLRIPITPSQVLEISG